MDEYNAMNTVLDMLLGQLIKMERGIEPIDEGKLINIDKTLNGLLKITLLISIADPVEREKAYKDCYHVRNIDNTEFLPKNLGNLFIRYGMMSAKIYSLRPKK